MSREETKISGIIFSRKDTYKRDGVEYFISPPNGNMSWAIPVQDLTPEDLRALADDLERRRGAKLNEGAV